MPKAPAKKTAAKKASVKKAAKKSAKKAPTKKTATKKAPARKAAAKKTPVKKTAAKKTAAKKTSAKRTTAAGSANKASTTKNAAATKKAAATKAATKKAPAKKTSTKQTSTKKTSTKKAAGRAPRLAVRSDEKPWTAKELAEVQGELDAEAGRLRAEISEAEDEIADLFRDGGDGAGHDQADVGSTTFERDHEMSLANHSRELLSQVERALQRIDDGTYGVCESCGNPIGKLRLMAFPRATLCVSCKQRQERR